MPTILLAHADHAGRAALARSIENAGYTVTALGRAQDVCLLAGQRPWDLLIISAGRLADQTGYDLCQALKKDRETAVIPLIVTECRPQQQDAFRVLGVDQLLIGPVDEYVLLARIAQALRKAPSVPRPARAQPRRIKPRCRRLILGGRDPEVMAYLHRELSARGCVVDLVQVGHEIIGRAISFRPEAILVNAQMRGEESSAGYIRAVRLLPECRSIPILVYSFYRVADLGSMDMGEEAVAVDRAQRECLEAGADHYLGVFSEQGFVERILKFIG